MQSHDNRTKRKPEWKQTAMLRQFDNINISASNCCLKPMVKPMPVDYPCELWQLRLCQRYHSDPTVIPDTWAATISDNCYLVSGLMHRSSNCLYERPDAAVRERRIFVTHIGYSHLACSAESQANSRRPGCATPLATSPSILLKRAASLASKAPVNLMPKR